MCFMKNVPSIRGKNDDTLDVMLVARSLRAMLENPYNSQGDYSIYDAATTFSKKNIKESKKLFIDYNYDYSF